LRKALNGTFPNLAQMKLVDYKVRVINGEAGTAAGVRVTIESRDEHDVWGTVGVSENIIEASWNALVDAIEYKLCKDEQAATVAPHAAPSALRAPTSA
jgi:2-isopropylmalate synthase